MTTIGKLLLTIRTIIRRSPARKSLVDWAAEMEADNDQLSQERKRR